MLGQQLVADDDEVVDRVVAALGERRVAGRLRVGDQRGQLRPVRRVADRGGQLAAQHRRGEVAGDDRAGQLGADGGATFGGGTYASTCSSPDGTQVTESRSRPCSSRRIARAQTPVVTV